MTAAAAEPRRRFTPRSLRSQVYLSFALVLGIVLVVGTLGYFGVSRLIANFSDLEEINTRSQDILQLDRSVIELSRNVQAFIFTGHEGVAGRVDDSLQRVDARLVAVEGRAEDEVEREMLGRMREHLQNYRASFQFAREERSLGKQLIEERLVALHDRIDDALIAAFAHGRMQEAEQQRIARNVLALERNLYAYLSDPDARRVDENDQVSRETIRLLEAAGAGEAADLIAAYHQTFTRVVQATRAYLYLTSVVMAAETREFIHVSEQLRDHVLSNLAPVREDIRELSAAIQFASWAGTLVALLVGLALSTAMANRLSRPISDITRTFAELAEGARGLQIPHEGRRDEIGRMAAAANVFQEKNEETRELLEHARLLAAELESHKSDLMDTNEELEEFVFTVSHDLKSPIVTSRNYVGVMRRLVEKGEPERALEKLDVLERSIDSMKRLVDDLLDLSRVGRVETELELLDMNALLAGLRDQYKEALRASGATLQLAENLPAILGNRTRVLQVFDNLIGNALKYAWQDGRCHIDVSAERRDGGVEYCVRDEGPGIAPEFHERVFALFQRLDKDRHGTGVGLSIVEKVMRLRGGHVKIDSKGIGDGAKFLLWFPDHPHA